VTQIFLRTETKNLPLIAEKYV